VHDLFEHAFEEAYCGMALVSPEGRYLRVNRTLCRLLGRSADELLDLTVVDITHPEDLKASRKMLATALTGDRPAYELKKRYIRSDGMPVWVLLTASLLRDVDGHPLCFLGQVIDIGERKRAEEEQQRLLARLVEVEEAERARIARELHEGLGQLLTSISLAAASLCDRKDAATRSRLEALRSAAEDALETARTLAWTLRPLRLANLGLGLALKRLVGELQVQTGLHIELDGADLAPLSPQVETSVYRVVQEALTNAIKHADARSASVVLDQRQEVLIAVVEDDGKGLDPVHSSAGRQEGMGVRHMEERAKSVGGELVVESTPGQGTLVRLTVPLRPPVITDPCPHG